MMTSIKTTINGKVNIDMAHGFDCVVRGQIVENFRSYEAARAYQRMHNTRANAITKDNLGKPKDKRQTVPPLCTILYYTA